MVSDLEHRSPAVLKVAGFLCIKAYIFRENLALGDTQVKPSPINISLNRVLMRKLGKQVADSCPAI